MKQKFLYTKTIEIHGKQFVDQNKAGLLTVTSCSNKHQALMTIF